MAAKKKHHHKVLKNTETVRKLIEMYVALHNNYQKAAEAISINKDTIAQYCTHRTNISLVIFEKISAQLQAHYSPEEIKAVTGGLSLKAIKAKAQMRNGAQIDHVMFQINDAVYDIIKFYSSFFESYAEAAKALGINPRTFKSYLLRQTSSIPRKYFLQVVEALKGLDYPEKRIFQRLGVKGWEEVLVEKRRSATICPTKNALKEELIKCFERGKIRQRDIEPTLHNASKRFYGSLGRAVRETMKELAKRMNLQAREFLGINDFERANETIERFRGYIELYAENERAVNKALPRHRKIAWEPTVEGYYKMVDQLVEQVTQRRLEMRRRTLKDLDGFVSIEDAASIQLRPYSLQARYSKGELLTHPAYGAGKVLRVFGSRHMVVQFGRRYGKKILLMNAKNPRPEFQSLNGSLSSG